MTTQLLMTAWDQHPHTYDPVRRPIVLSLSRPPIYRQPPERAAELATSPPGRVRSIAISMPVCLCVCPPAYLTNVTFKKLYEYMISVAVAQFFSDDNAIYTL